VSQVSPDRPIFWIVAGPNGSGKSSSYQDTDIDAFARSIWIINPDLLTARLQQDEGLDLGAANLEAVKRIEVWLEASIRAHQSVGVETVLSTEKYRRLVVMAKSLKFEVRLTYVILDSPERCIDRVRRRVAKGGHAVPEDKIVERYARSLNQLPWFLERADRALLFDNSGESAVLIGRKRNSIVRLEPKALPAVVAALRKPTTE
jgi:predicted ABC-type ATPase